MGQSLRSYATAIEHSALGVCNLRMKISARVIDVRKATCLMTECWKVTTRSCSSLPASDDDEEVGEFFDGVVVAIGSYHVLSVPEQYPHFVAYWSECHQGSVIHSLNFGRLEAFLGQVGHSSRCPGARPLISLAKNVLVVDNSASEWDVSLRLTNVAKTVSVSSRRYRPNEESTAPKTTGKPAICSWSTEKKSVTFEDGSTIRDVGSVILCTTTHTISPSSSKGLELG